MAAVASAQSLFTDAPSWRCMCNPCGEPCYIMPMSTPTPAAAESSPTSCFDSACGLNECNVTRTPSPGCCSACNCSEITQLNQSNTDTAAVAYAAAACSVQPQQSTASSVVDRLRSDEQLLARLGEEALAYAMTRGITMLRHPPLSQADQVPTVMHAPMTLLPTRLHAPLYNAVHSLVPHLSLLYERVSRDVPFLVSVLSDSAAEDPFLARLLDMLQRLDQSTDPFARQTLTLAINRSDYMLHDEDMEQVEGCERCVMVPNSTRDEDGGSAAGASCVSLKQVEFNSISCGANSLSHRVSEMHRSLLERVGGVEDVGQLHLPTNKAIDNIVAAMAQAHTLFIEQRVRPLPALTAAPTPVVILFLVQAREANMADQKALELALWENHRIRVTRMTLGDVEAHTHMDPQTGLLWIEAAQPLRSRQLVSLVYFRAGYTPRDYASLSLTSSSSSSSSDVVAAAAAVGEGAAEWAALERIHRSVAVKCPSLGYHLAGAKKMQQVLTLPGMLERFITGTPGSQQTCRDLRSTFVNLYPLTHESVARALAFPDRFVLKPQREGGGNNLWGEDMARLLRASSLEQLQHFILMDVIGRGGSNTATTSTTMSERVATLKGGRVVIESRAVSELGMVGCMISEEEASGVEEEEEDGAAAASPTPKLIVHRNEYAGYLLRTKNAELNEGGLMSMAGAIDSLMLIEPPVVGCRPNSPGGGK